MRVARLIVLTSLPLLEPSVQEISPVEGVALYRAEACIANNVPQLLFRGAVTHTGRANDVLLEHYGAYIVAPKAQTKLQDFETLRHPTGLNVQNVVEVETRNSEDLEVLDRGGFVPLAATERRVPGLE